MSVNSWEKFQIIFSSLKFFLLFFGPQPTPSANPLPNVKFQICLLFKRWRVVCVSPIVVKQGKNVMLGKNCGAWHNFQHKQGPRPGVIGTLLYYIRWTFSTTKYDFIEDFYTSFNSMRTSIWHICVLSILLWLSGVTTKIIN